MKKKFKKIIYIVILAIIISIFMIVNSYAYEWSTLIDDAKNVSSVPTDANKIKNVISSILSIIRYTGSAVAILAVMIMGIRYMVASSQDKAEYKKKLIPMGIGAVLLFSASQIIGIIGQIAVDMNTKLGE